MNVVNEIVEPVFEAERVTLRDGREVLLRSGVSEDAAAVLAYMNRCLPDFSPYVATAPDEFTVTEAFEQEWLASQCNTPGACVVLAVAGEQVVGLLNCSVNANRRRLAHIGQLGMSSDEDYWGSGMGSAMMSRMIDWAEANPALGMLQLQVYADNERALRLYKGHGFVEAGTIPRRTRFADGTTRDDVIMYRRVDGTLSDKPKAGDFCEDLGDGVVLRCVCYGDAEELFPIYERNRERFRPWFRWTSGIRSVGDVRSAIAQWIERGIAENKLTCVIEENEAILGAVYIVRHTPDDRKIELGYWLDEGQEGRGLATRGCRALIRYAFGVLESNRIDITADVNNARSQAVAERLGFTREAVIRQWLRFEGGRYADVANYRLLREDWERQARP